MPHHGRTNGGRDFGSRVAEGGTRHRRRTPDHRRRKGSDPLDMTRSQGYGHWAVDVDDLDAAFAWLIDVGATEVWPPADAVAPGARFGYVKDPEGNLIELIQPTAPGQRGGVC